MDFRTILDPALAEYKLTHKDQLIFVGSCFSEHFGDRLAELGFDCESNPFGVMFHPLAIAENLRRSITAYKSKEEDLVFYSWKWNYWMLHGKFGNEDKEKLMEAADKLYADLYQKLSSASVLFITMGSAWAYEFEGSIVANCHKVPKAKFAKRMTPVAEIVAGMSSVMEQLKEFNPALKVVFTVSPVKHIRDGISENLLSKSTLLLACKELCDKFAHDYFPSYELVTEDLRDYRFYEKDMAHPTAQAIDYVWEKFCSVYFDERQMRLHNRLEKLLQMRRHRPLFPESEEHKALEAKITAEAEQIFQDTGIRV